MPRKNKNAGNQPQASNGGTDKEQSAGTPSSGDTQASAGEGANPTQGNTTPEGTAGETTEEQSAETPSADDQTTPGSESVDASATPETPTSDTDQEQVGEEVPLTGQVALEIAHDVALGSGTRRRGFRMGTCPMVEGELNLDEFEPAEGVTEREVNVLKDNIQAVNTVVLTDDEAETES